MKTYLVIGYRETEGNPSGKWELLEILDLRKQEVKDNSYLADLSTRHPEHDEFKLIKTKVVAWEDAMHVCPSTANQID